MIAFTHQTKEAPLKRASITAALIVASISIPIAAQATSDDYSCPQGTTFDYKVEPLSGKTFVVPTPPGDWVVTAVILKVGGPGGGTHLPPFTPVTPGQVLDVSNQQYDISHAHVCKGRTQETTTSTSTTSSTTSTSTSTTTSPTTTVGQSTTTVPASTTTAPESTSTSSPTTSTEPSTTAPITSVASSSSTSSLPTSTLSPTTSPTNPSTAPSTSVTSTCLDSSGQTIPAGDGSGCALPKTGGELALAAWAALALCLGGIGLLLARRPA